MSDQDQNDAYNSGLRGGYVHMPGTGDSYNQGLKDGGHNDNPGACFPGDTKILTPTGPIRIDALNAGDKILSWSEASRQLVTCAIKKVKIHGAKTIVRIDLSDGGSVRATSSHTIRTQDSWKRIDHLVQGDCIVRASGDNARVLRISLTGDKLPVFNLTTQGEHNFIAEGIVAHNFTVLRRTRSALHRMADALGFSRAASPQDLFSEPGDAKLA
ncbi:MAG: hypothetical protein QOD89_2177 [Bradyrhizobium sp.]|jgi:hypothetical protein|nr:hypothetical protein [Bradyrhizobium sp.]